MSDMQMLCGMIADGPLKSFCFQRLEFLQNKYKLHNLLNEIRVCCTGQAQATFGYYFVLCHTTTRSNICIVHLCYVFTGACRAEGGQSQRFLQREEGKVIVIPMFVWSILAHGAPFYTIVQKQCCALGIVF